MSWIILSGTNFQEFLGPRTRHPEIHWIFMIIPIEIAVIGVYRYAPFLDTPMWIFEFNLKAIRYAVNVKLAKPTVKNNRLHCQGTT